MAKKNAREIFLGRLKNGIFFPFHHETLKRKDREVEKVANRVMVESFENLRKVSFSQ